MAITSICFSPKWSPVATIIHVSANRRPQGVALKIICSKLKPWALVLKLNCYYYYFFFCQNENDKTQHGSCHLPLTARKLSSLSGLWQDRLQASATLHTSKQLMDVHTKCFWNTDASDLDVTFCLKVFCCVLLHAGLQWSSVTAWLL